MAGAIDWADGLPITCNTRTRKLYQNDDHFILMQYTGLKDKNGKEIYEGDVVRTHNDMASEQVYWNNEYAQFSKGRVIDGVFSNIHEDISYCEVIGNIYENPDLLK